MIERKEMPKSLYNLFRTRIEISGSKYHWEVATIDVKKFFDRFGEGKQSKSKIFRLLSTTAESVAGEKPLYESIVYQTFEGEKNFAEVLKRQKTADQRLYFLQSYNSAEEARFGHEELVQSLLSGQFFSEDNHELSEYILCPDVGEILENINSNSLTPFFLPNVDPNFEDWLDGDCFDEWDDIEEIITSKKKNRVI